MSRYHDETEKIKVIEDVLSQHSKILVPEDLKGSFDRVCDYLATYRTPSPFQTPLPPHQNSVEIPEVPQIEKVRASWTYKKKKRSRL